MANSVDERLLNRDDQNGAAGKLRERKRGEAGEEGGAEAGAAGEPQSLRQRIMQAKQAMNLKELAKKKLKEKVTAPAKAGTSRLLQLAWVNVIDSFGLTLIYINMHVFLRWVFPDLFCKLGEEWLPKIVASESSAKNVAGTAFGIIEVMGLLLIDLILLFIIFAALALIVMIVNFMGASWWGKLKYIWEAVTTLGWGVVKPLLNLF